MGEKGTLKGIARCCTTFSQRHFSITLKGYYRGGQSGQVYGGRRYRFLSTLRQISFLGHPRRNHHIRMAFLCYD